MNGFLKKDKNFILKNWIDLFQSIPKKSSYSKKNFDFFLKSKIPNKNLEDWKYTSLDFFFKKKFLFQKKIISFNKDTISKISLGINAVCLVFIDGKFSDELSNKNFDFFKIHIDNTNALDNKPIKPEFFLYLNESFSQQVTQINLPKGVTSLRPLYLLHVTTSNTLNKNNINCAFYRHNIHIESNAKTEIIEHYISFSKNFSHFTNSRVTLKIENNSNVLHTKIVFENKKSYHFSHNDIVIFNNSNIKSQNFLLGNNIIRNNISTRFNGKNSDIEINSLALPKNYSTSDIRTYLEHKKKFCYSRQLHKFILLKKSIGIFDGFIKVYKNAIQTDGKMINKNLLLGNLNKMYTKPQLEIYADDVKCNHAVTIGHIEKSQTFYLCSRGIEYSLAKKMIIIAFASDLIININNENLRTIILNYISQYILGKKNDF